MYILGEIKTGSVYDKILSIIVHSLTDSFPGSLIIRLTSPGTLSSIYSLEDNIKKLNIEEVYDYDIRLTTKETGWYLVELGSVGTSGNTDEIILYDKKMIYFRD